MLDADYRPIGAPERAPRRPVFPARVRSFMYACGRAAAIMEGRMKETKPIRPVREREERRVDVDIWTPPSAEV